MNRDPLTVSYVSSSFFFTSKSRCRSRRHSRHSLAKSINKQTAEHNLHRCCHYVLPTFVATVKRAKLKIIENDNIQ